VTRVRPVWTKGEQTTFLSAPPSFWLLGRRRRGKWGRRELRDRYRGQGLSPEKAKVSVTAVEVVGALGKKASADGDGESLSLISCRAGVLAGCRGRPRRLLNERESSRALESTHTR